MISKSDVGTIVGDRIFLRPLTFEDLPMTLAWRNQDSMRIWFINSDTITPEQHREWFNAYQTKNNDFVFIIEERQIYNRSIGQISLYNIDWERKKAEFGRLMIADLEMRGKGLAKEATELLVQFAGNKLEIKEIYLDVFENNLPAIAVYQSCGFIKTGVHNHLIRMVNIINSTILLE
jgi:diamine N-acetyltransferase